MEKFFILFLLFSMLLSCKNTSLKDKAPDEKDQTFMVEGKPFMINGMNWDYYPIGTNYDYNLWEQNDTFIKAALDYEMSLLEAIGINTIRQYTGVPARWISYIFHEYGIYTMLNHPFGRYGYQSEDKWIANTNYSDPEAGKILLEEVSKLAKDYKDTDGLLLYLLGNENNYGLFWEGGETEDIPENNPEVAKQARSMFQLFNQAAKEIKKIDSSHQVAICNGDLLFLDIVIEECTDIDIYGTNMYRGKSFTDAFKRVREEYGKPILFTEFGADAYNSKLREEDQEAQAFYLLENWKEIYLNTAGLTNGNCIGGFTFQFSDGWWKFGQTKKLEQHDTNASWNNAGYTYDFVEGTNNMNEEWFGICEKVVSGKNEIYELHPRLAYYVLKKIHQFNPYAENITADQIEHYFDEIDFLKLKVD